MSLHTPYDPAQHLEPAREMSLRGATVRELADFFGVSIASIELWAACHADFADALRVGQELADDRVERSLYSRCVGHTVDSEKILVVEGEIVHEPVREYFPPDTGAAFTWLKNRRPAKWRDRREESHDSNVTVTIKRVKVDGV